ncbi:MAG: peptidyl-prolyl cis-trans isomerase [Desulfovibrionaceae bacterium]|nr:peptidyl-prolyl cis-trans isomerase [Desulfovibrionaceae bacterium]
MKTILKIMILALLVLVVPANAVCADAPKVRLETNMGDIVLELDPARAPLTTENFLKYVESEHYDGTIFHRVIDGFMIQGGGFDEDMEQKETQYPPVRNEAANGLKNEKYSVAMARTADPHSATAQFFINVKNNTFLDYPGQDGWGYAVFGKVIEGQDIVDEIAKVETGNRGMHQDVPVDNVVILRALLI